MFYSSVVFFFNYFSQLLLFEFLHSEKKWLLKSWELGSWSMCCVKSFLCFVFFFFFHQTSASFIWASYFVLQSWWIITVFTFVMFLTLHTVTVSSHLSSMLLSPVYVVYLAQKPLHVFACPFHSAFSSTSDVSIEMGTKSRLACISNEVLWVND